MPQQRPCIRLGATAMKPLSINYSYLANGMLSTDDMFKAMR